MLVENFLELFLESAPWLLLGLLIAGLLKMFVSMEWMNKQLGGYGFKTVIKAALFGAPLPLCSCGVIPAAVGLRRAGASKAATTTFMVSTPETGVDSVSVSYILLGPFMAIVRPIAAVISAIVAGMLVGPDSKDDVITQESKAESKGDVQSSCCSTKKVEPVKAESGCSSQKQESVKAESSCCSSKSESHEHHGHSHSQAESPQGFFAKIIAGIKYAATDLVRDTTIWLLVGIFFAAVVKTYVPEDFLAQHGSGIIAMLVMIAISVPMYICATASTPIAAGLLLAGISPGAVLVFMLAGPATNIATLGVVTKELGKRALFGYLSGVIGVAVIAGFITDFVVEKYGIVVAPQIGEQHAMLPQSVVAISGIVLALLMGKVIYDKLPLKSKPKDCCS
ncbi:SO_0444 family Cu/Zn efflux transporter [Shewanella sp. 202IG2-18]|uniref:SO_0444 family Cu/Zn efflux transporter n=1 Tax=Parashewanella hymeniacidonis TaxID=2807618 RepID=UPI0019609B86|nr:SO_0444 family Cu/Zn efflux transporter [Parashewanella hymeniacidonis]MBM7071153.1 SO_0444 family Cu/Zn efflux transporter [Parashewanella hymeniacidonis]